MDAQTAQIILDEEHRRGLAEFDAAAGLDALEAAETSVLGRRSRFQARALLCGWAASSA